MKDAQGHGSNPRGGSAAQPVRAAFTKGIQAAQSVSRTALAMMRDEKAGGKDWTYEAVSFLAKHGEALDPVTLGELPATRAVGMVARAAGWL